jgi:hypothetical protein
MKHNVHGIGTTATRGPFESSGLALAGWQRSHQESSRIQQASLISFYGSPLGSSPHPALRFAGLLPRTNAVESSSSMAARYWSQLRAFAQTELQASSRMTRGPRMGIAAVISKTVYILRVHLGTLFASLLFF